MSKPIDFYQPQRQDPVGIVIGFFNGMRKAVRAFFPLLIILYSRLSGQDSQWWTTVGLVAIGGLLLMLVYAYLNYRNFTFSIDQGTASLVIEKGVITKSKTTIQLSKIQQVNINQSFLDKILEVYSVEVESAGSSAKEGVIPAVSLLIGQSLKETLLAYRENTDVNNTEEVETAQREEDVTVELKKISLTTLFKIGLTANYLYTIGLVVVFFNTLYYEGTRLYKGIFQRELLEEFQTTAISVGMTISLVVSFLILALFVNLVRTIIRYYNFEIKLQNNSLLLSYGLFHTKSTIIRPTRVQFIRLTRNYFQKLMNITNFRIYQVSGNENENKKTALDIPGCSQEELAALVDMIYTQPLQWEGEKIKHNYRYFGFRFFLLVIIPTLVGSFILQDILTMNWLVIAILGYFVFMTMLVWRYYHNGGLIYTNDYIVIRSGVWDISYSVLEPFKIQKIVVSQLAWQRPYNVGSIRLYTAGGSLVFSTSDYCALCKLRDKWLAIVEKEQKAWM
ncbi:PH domain-containing protein [Myroides pelagicus]|uniref:PH domain-containing protein n=1 Tax=Myroides pelagicus TaxID=270914 RepID=A0A7K1GNB1_9FLAO|nr:PH domain-containing protein [Myroides pelagicus]MEC4114349.1 PH domain-containing protein [Myroides pelagicus]MTH29873.1 PH domain-containing protein [Myroides pelagicus]